MPAVAGGRFELPARGAHGAASTWARSTAADVERALTSLACSAQAWHGTDPAQRRAILDRASSCLLSHPDPEGQALDAIGLGAGDRAALLVGLEQALEDTRAQIVGDDAPGITGLRSSWSQRLAGPARSVFTELAAGRVVLLFSDGCVPAFANRLADVLLEAGLPPAALALLHDDGDAALQAAAVDRRLSRLRVWGHSQDKARCAPIFARAAHSTHFGAGVLGADQGRDMKFELLRREHRTVDPGQDPAVAVDQILQAAFGRLQTLSGQASEQVGSVEIAPRRISTFTETLLVALEAEGAADPALEPIEADMAAQLEQVRELGLNEGATLIHEARVPSRLASNGARIARLVFTNVEPRMRLHDWSRPSPVLLISRSETEQR